MATKLTLNQIDESTQKQIVYPVLEKMVVPNYPEYMNGHRENVSARGTSNLESFAGTPSELITKIGADFKAIKQPAFRVNSNGDYEEVKNCSFLVNSKNDKVIGRNITDRYEIFDFDNAILYYLSVLDEIKKKGYDVKPAYGKVYNDGARMFLQYKISSGQVMGEDVDNYIALVTSHDKSAGFTVAYSMVRLFCQNQIHRMLHDATQKTTLRHSKSNQNKINQEAERIIRASEAQEIAMKNYTKYLASIKITDQDIFDAYGKIKGLEDSDSQRFVDNFSEQVAQLLSCYDMPDLANFKGTALGAYYAFSDFAQHVVPLRKTKDESFVEQSLNGNEQLGYFTDTLLEIAK